MGEQNADKQVQKHKYASDLLSVALDTSILHSSCSLTSSLI